jgi:hypothetical protein
MYSVGMIYNGPANGTLYSFLKSNHADTLGKFTGLYPGDTVIVSAKYLAVNKLEDKTYFRLAGASSDFFIPTKCGNYLIDESFGVLTVFGTIDATGAQCNLTNPPTCACVGGIRSLTVELNNIEDSLLTNYTVNFWANASHTVLLASYSAVNDGDEMIVTGAVLPGGLLSFFTYVEIVERPQDGDIKLETTCTGNGNGIGNDLVGSTFGSLFVITQEDSVGNKCTDLSGPNSCGNGKTLMCHTPKHGHSNKGPHTHCVKNKDVQKKLQKNTRPNHAGEWAVGACSNLRVGQFDETTVDERVADGRIELSAFPNPFSQATTIRFRMPESGNVKLGVYSITGQEISNLYNGEVTGGKDYKFEFKAANHPYGMYFYRLETADGKVYTNKLVLTK